MQTKKMSTRRFEIASSQETDKMSRNAGEIPLQRYTNDKKTDDTDAGSQKKINTKIEKLIVNNPKTLYYCCLFIINFIAVIYFIFATIYWRSKKAEKEFNWCNGYGLLLLLYCFVYGRLAYNYVLKKVYHSTPDRFRSYWSKLNSLTKRCNAEIMLLSCMIIAISVFLIIDTWNSKQKLVGLGGVFFIILFGWVFSKHRKEVVWRAIIWGLIIQFLFGLISIRWSIGRSIFQCLSEKVKTFLDFSKSGASSVYSERLVEEGTFAFSVLPILFFFSSTVSILYHLGVIQYIIKTIGWALYAILGTTVCESLHAATTLFLGMPESFLVIEPYLNELTTSEIHTIMCSCFATTSGTVMAAYISFGAEPIHLLTATLMSAPAGLTIAKLIYPEKQKSSTTFKNIKFKESENFSLLDAIAHGATSAIPLVLGITANLIVFVSAVVFLNSIISWFGYLVGYPEITFELIVSKLFIPVSFLMGVPWDQCESVASLVGLKTMVNEFVAYQKLGILKRDGLLTKRAEAIATYAICGFSNPASIGIMMGSLSSMAPSRKTDIVNTVLRAFVGGCAVCFLTASIAGILIDEESFESHGSL
ncbi:solute carrier family 28 member 3-like isoform X1 [Trichogramma pretiosum]|uniref:solute carrier family 28 member 3-like isoform X1 n=1 Tax=Trichogramma pretiosum TaxID=7493 RepID=UPI0006C9A8D4|nr:solute carrier family 28 member 3-like isoform X1 [Trichogramma pretiosum]XP_014236424.1 solute carrier family 28 member 3-like isoform X1 [Trichogramma pretiosum]